MKDGVPAYQENDIMMAVSYLNGVANILNRPLVICVALGNSAGSHASEGFLPSYLNYICGRRKRVVVTAAGNEANARHHFQGRIIERWNMRDAEITVEENTKGFCGIVGICTGTVCSHHNIAFGEQIPRILVRRGASEQFHFILREQQLRWITGSIQKRRLASSYFSVLSDRHRDCGRYAFSRS